MQTWRMHDFDMLIARKSISSFAKIAKNFTTFQIHVGQ